MQNSTKIKRKQIPIHLSDRERKDLEAIAHEWGESLSGAIRRLIVERMKEKIEK